MPQSFLCIFLVVFALSAQALQKGEGLLKQGQFEQAETFYKNELQANSDENVGAEIGLARVYLQSKQYDRAIQSLEGITKKHAQVAEAWFWLGVAHGRAASEAGMLSAMSHAKSARGAFHKAIEVDPTYVPGYEGLIRFYLNAPGVAGGSKKKALVSIAALEKVDVGAASSSRLRWLTKNNEIAVAREQALYILETYSNKPSYVTQAALHLLNEKNLPDIPIQRKALDSLSRVANTEVKENEESYWDNLYWIQVARYQYARIIILHDVNKASLVISAITSLRDYLEGPALDDLPPKTWAQLRLAQALIKEDHALAQIELDLLKKNIADDVDDKALEKEINELSMELRE